MENTQIKQLEDYCQKRKCDFSKLLTKINFLKTKGYDFLDFLGDGCQGVVIKAYSQKLNKIVAIKFNFSNDFQQSYEEYIKNEVEMLELLKNNQEFLDLYESFEHFQSNQKSSRFIVMQMCDGRLTDLIHKLEIDHIYDISMQLLKGLKILEEKRIIHCDIKPDNILYIKQQNRYLIKIVDLCFSCILQENTTKLFLKIDAILGTPFYMCQERIANQCLTIKSDIYSLGVVFLELALGLDKNKEILNWMDLKDYKIDKILQERKHKNIDISYIEQIIKNMITPEDKRLSPTQLILILQPIHSSQNINQLILENNYMEKMSITFDDQFKKKCLELLSEIYFYKSENIIKDIQLLIEKNQEFESQILELNQKQQLIQQIIKLLKYMNGEDFNLTYKQVIFYILYLSFMDNISKQQDITEGENLKIQKEIESSIEQSDKFDYLSSHEFFSLYLLQKFYEQFNIKIKFTKTQQVDQTLNNLMEHFLLSGQIENTYYMDIGFENDNRMNYQIVSNNPIALRKMLNELGLKNHMILKIYEGSICCHLYPTEQVIVKIRNKKKQSYHSFLDGQLLKISHILNPSHNIYYSVDHYQMEQQYRGFIEVKEKKNNSEFEIRKEDQPHNFPIGYFGIGLNIKKYQDLLFIKDTTEEGVWITGFHGITPNRQGNHSHIIDIIQNGFIISKNSEQETWKDAMAGLECRFNKQLIGEGNIYFANTIRTKIQEVRDDRGGAEVYTLPIKINNNEYCIIFMCRLNPKQVYSPVGKDLGVQFLVKDNFNARPYRVLIMEKIKNEQEINLNFEQEGSYLRSNFKHYENETQETLLKKLQKCNLYDPIKEKIKIKLQNNAYVEIGDIRNNKVALKQLIKIHKPVFQYYDPEKKVKTYFGKIRPKQYKK